MDKFKVLKGVARFLSSAGVGVAISNIISFTTPVQASILTKILSGIGEFVISGYLAEKGSDYIVEQLDELAKKPEKPKSE